MIQNKTKIICTISDFNCDVEFLKSLYDRGMTAVRINSAHAPVEGAQKIVDNTRAVSDKIAIFVDTKGPEVRLNKMESEEGFEAKQGDIIYISNDTEKLACQETLHTNCATIVEDVPVGAHILIDDGSVELKVVDKEKDRLVSTVVNSGVIKGRKSINVPNVRIGLPSLTPKDKVFINWAIDANIDFIAHSFVRSKEDLAEIQEVLDKRKSHIKIIAKIENQQGIDNLEEILHNCSGIMIARGDLGVEIPPERIPIVQRDLVNKCREFRKPVIIATQMLHSMIDSPRPTRAEVTDVSNAIFQRTDAIMLSGETAAGKYPLQAVETMSRIAAVSEANMEVVLDELDIEQSHYLKPIAATLAYNLVKATVQLPVKAIILDTWTGRTGRYIAAFRPKVPIYAMCYRDFTMRQMAMVYGVFAYRLEIQENKEAMVKRCLEILVNEGRLKKGDLVGFIGGSFNDELGASYMEFKYV